MACLEAAFSTLDGMEFLLDIVFVSIASAFFALALGYVLICDRLMK